MDDGQILDRIGALVSEERTLRERAAQHGGLTGDERERLQRVEERLDQCWDLLRQRRAREEFGQDPEAVHSRPTAQVESYLQ